MPSWVGPFLAGQNSGVVAGCAFSKTGSRARTKAVRESVKDMRVELTVGRENSFEWKRARAVSGLQSYPLRVMKMTMLRA